MHSEEHIVKPTGVKLWREVIKSKKFRELLEKEKKELEINI